MIAWELIERVTVPDSTQVLELFQRAHELSIRVDGCELMNSRQHGSEELLAELACDAIAGAKNPCMLIGGLGMGFTLAAALARLDAQASVVVSELVPAVVAWNRGVLGPLAGFPLRDPRVRVELTDVSELIAAGRAHYDAIVLDVDNGPASMTRDSNERLYRAASLRAAHVALRPGGVLGVWSCSLVPSFTRQLRRAGFAVSEHSARARGPRGGARHTLWMARKQVPRPGQAKARW